MNTPTILFLGLCEHVAHVPDGNTNVHKWNVLGLRHVVLSHVFPMPLVDYSMALAFPAPTSEREIVLRLTKPNGKEAGRVTINVTGVNEPEDKRTSRLRPAVQQAPVGCTPVFLSLRDTKWKVLDPGIYYVDEVHGDSFVTIGSINFVAIDAEPLSTERIAAIRSDPNASRELVFEITCELCSEQFKTYTALERSDVLEHNGWIWYQNIANRFDCKCGALSIDLQYIRRNLHAYLGQLLRCDSRLHLIPLYEESSIRAIRAAFSTLINRDPREEDIQSFINENPIILHQFPALRIIAKPPILNAYVADFAILTPHRELILVELEKASTQLIRKKGDIAAPLSHAFDQVQNWLHELDEHRLAILDSLRIDRHAVGSVRGVVIAGRDVGYDARDLRKLKGRDFGRASFFTYDDLVFALDALTRRVEGK